MEPPTSNTGVLPTHSQGQSQEQSRTALVDAFAATFKTAESWPALAEALGFDTSEARALTHGRYSYRQAVQLGETVILYDGAPGMGISVQMMGQACAELTARLGADALPELCRRTLALGGRPTRLDLAIDDRTAELSLEMIERTPVRTRWRETSTQTKRDITTGQGTGHTVYFGAPASLSRLRVYDKAAQQGQAEPWLRFELQLRDERAIFAAQELAAGKQVGELTAGLMAGCIAFLDPNPLDTNRSRWNVTAWWDAWLGGVAKLRFGTVARAARTLEEVKRVLLHQYAPIIAAIHEATGSEAATKFFARAVSEGRRRFKDKHHAIVAEALAVAKLAAIQLDRPTLYREAWGPSYA
jgi:phage replication initiation protein